MAIPFIDLSNVVKWFVGSGSGTNGDPYAIGVNLYGKKSVAGDTALTAAIPADGIALSDVLQAMVANQLYNGATLDLMRNNTEGTALASVARTATTSSSDIINYNARGIAIFFNVSLSNATSLTLSVQEKDPISGSYATLYSATAVTTTGMRLYTIYPGINSGGTQAYQSAIGRTLRITVTHGDSNSNTYSVGYSFIV